MNDALVRSLVLLIVSTGCPQELFGPLSLAALERDEYKRATSGYAPDSELIFIDEIFKGNTALLNSLLGIMAERLFDHGSTRTSLDDLRCVVGASHHPPEDEESLSVPATAPGALDRPPGLDPSDPPQEAPPPALTLVTGDVSKKVKENYQKSSEPPGAFFPEKKP